MRKSTYYSAIAFAALAAVPQAGLTQVQPGAYTGTLSCGEMLGDSPRPGWSTPVAVEIRGTQIIWTRKGSDMSGGRSEYLETGSTSLYSTNTAYMEAEGRYMPGSARTGSWVTRGELSLQGNQLEGAYFTQVDVGRTRIFRNCTVKIPVRLAEHSLPAGSPVPIPSAIVRPAPAPAGGMVPSAGPTASAPQPASAGRTLPEPMHGKVRSAAMTPSDAADATRAVMGVLLQGGFLDGLPPVNDRTHYRCAREGRDWLNGAASDAINGAMVLAERERHQRSLDNWLAGMQQACGPEFFNAARSRVQQLLSSMQGVRAARATQADQVRAEEAAKRQREDDQKKAAAAEVEQKNRTARVEAEAAQAAQRFRDEANVTRERQSRQTRADELKSGKAKVESLEDAALLTDATGGQMLYVRPPLGAQPGAYIFSGTLQGRQGGTLIVGVGSKFSFTVEITRNTKFLSGSMSDLRVGSYVSFVGNYLGANGSGGDSWATFRALYVR